ncbi:MAG: DNA-directed RNA polymerase sigma-70 factor [Gemmatimonadota bacterium]|nr:MAG: DNA-directed RNA polymerase sigma-70 factor [Gemmatimonadota bacterium]
MDPKEDVTVLLQAMKAGDQDAFDRLVPLVYDELRLIARNHLRRHRRSETLNTTALVHEVYVKMAKQGGLDAQDRAHFLAVSACAMRQVIVQFARARTAEKRGGGESALPLEEQQIAIDDHAHQLLEIDRILDRLRDKDERLARVVECRFFAGLNEAETAEAMDVSLRTAQRDWMRARAWLRVELAESVE